MDDSKILELFFERNEDAIRYTDQAYGRGLHCLAMNIVKNSQDAEESVSDTYFWAWNSIPPQRLNYFFSYLAKICRNLALGKLNWMNAAKRKAEVVLLTQEMEQCIPDKRRDREMEVKELGLILGHFLRTLSPGYQMVFLRRYWYADTIAEIAIRYGLSESTVQMRLSRTNAKLSKYLEKEASRYERQGYSLRT